MKKANEIHSLKEDKKYLDIRSKIENMKNELCIIDLNYFLKNNFPERDEVIIKFAEGLKKLKSELRGIF